MSEPQDALPAFGRALLRHRQVAKLSQADLARASGLSVRTLRDLEHGRAQAPKQQSAYLLADALGLTADERRSFLAVAREGRRRSPQTVAPSLLHVLPLVPDLVGREEEFAWLRGEAMAGGVVAIVGPPGVGKTTLAVSALHRLAPHFPDGCVALDLRGVDEQPVTALAALERLLTALNVPRSQMPSGVEELSSLLRELLRNRQTLVLLDNVADEAQLRPLVGTGSSGLTMVTSRRALTELAQVRSLPLEPLPAVDALAMFAGIAGEQVVHSEPEASVQLVALCGNLPLAVRIVGNRLATRRHWTVAYLVAQLRDDRSRLTTLSAGDRQVRAAFDVSYRRLSPDARRLFRRLALVPGPSFDEGLAKVAGGMPGEAAPVLDELAEASLLQHAAAAERLQFHDLIRVFAGEQLATEEDPATRDRLRDGLLGHLIERATSAARLFFPSVQDVPQDSAFPSREAAADWLSRENANWVAAQRVAARLGWHRQVIELAKAMPYYGDSRAHVHPWHEILGTALDAARAVGDRQDELTLLNLFGWAQYICLNDNEAGLATYLEALALAEQLGDRRERLNAQRRIPSILLRLGQFDEALAHAEAAAEVSMEFGFYDVQGPTRVGLGVALRQAGKPEEALAVFRALLAEMDDHRGEINPEAERWVRMIKLRGAGRCLSALGRWQEAANTHHEACSLAEANRNDYQMAEEMLHEGVAWREAGEHERARRCLELAFNTFDETLHGADRERVEAELAQLPPPA
ncbi:helix-turn-helix domain-containing protein [Umezawaea tangerina]|uniref:Tetratricopeptide repeat protein n=1 Tax=Umezawaea tangerina TaxID=84725 RepID=A0A2T0SZW7_9PSEU|nr:helix-turn-helix domain-containing protein [Umezawaea tangerina]PRY38962.1 tetratricopeptide repeat protein [Umezawaea tangerina]